MIWTDDDDGDGDDELKVDGGDGVEIWSQIYM